MSESLWLDSSVIRLGPTKLRELAEKAKLCGVRLFVHPHIHLEMCRYYRQSRRDRGMKFLPSYVESSLAQLNIEIPQITLNRENAELWAERLDQRYPGEADWKHAKAKTVKSRLPEDAKIDPQDVPMTTDWLVALEIESQNGFVAVNDQGEEWQALRAMKPPRAMSYKETIAWLNEKLNPAQLPDS